jgi:predicted RND superfamily exporter protein
MKNDMSSTFFLSFLAVIILFVIAYKNPFSFIYAAVPLILGELWTFGAAYLFVDSINVLTGVTAAIIVGLGIDFSIHIYSRFLDEYYLLEDTKKALVNTLAETGSSTLAGGLTTAAAFSAMTFSSFKGLQEFGIVASLGILSILLSVFIVLPLLFLMKKKIKKPKKLTRFGLHFFHPLIDRYYREIFIGYSIVICIFFILAVNLKFNTNMRQLRSMSNPAIQLQTTLTEKFGASFRPFTVVLSAKNENQLSKLYLEFEQNLKNMNVAKVQSIFSIVPTIKKQEQNIAFMKTQKLPENIVNNFLNAFDKANLTCTSECKTYISSLAESLTADKPLTLKDIAKSKMYPLFANMLKTDNSQIRIALNIFPKNAMWNKQETAKLIAEIQSFLNQSTDTKTNFITGITILVNEIKRLIKDNYYTSSALALFLVFSIVFFHYKSLKLTLIAFFPLVTGLIAMLGMLKLTKQDITLFNFIATPMLIGIGIDDGIHIFDRFLASGKKDITDTVIHTGKAITFTSLTTIIGFGSLFVSHFEGFVSLGLTTIYGVFFCWLSSLFYFPAFLKLTYCSDKKHLQIADKKKKKRKKHIHTADKEKEL